MGAVISYLQDVYFSLCMIVKTLSTLNSQFDALLKRAVAAPGLPVPDPTTAFWQQSPPFPELSDVQGVIPNEADIVVVGSGITGVAAVKSLLELSSSDTASPPPRIVVLEARQLCSGATGRNGGHIKCVPYELFPRLRGQHGADKACDMIRFQLRHLDLLLELGAHHPAGQVREVETVDLFVDAVAFDKAKRDVEETRPFFPDMNFVVWEGGAELRDKFGVNDLVVGAVSYKAGALWPFRLVTSLWKDLLARYPNLTISTHTPVEAVARDDASPQHPYRVRTSRGVLRARQVLHATNAHAPQLVPALRGSLTGGLAHMTAQTPGQQFPRSHGQRSWSIIYGTGFDYVTQLPDAADGSPGHVMAGGGFMLSKEHGLDHVGMWDDARMDALTTMHLHGTMAAVFRPSWGPGASVDSAWTGLLDFTGDMLPMVSRLPAPGSAPASRKPLGRTDAGEWIAAGFNGEGMVWAWLCGTAVAVMMLGLEEDDLKPGLGRPGGKLGEWFLKEELAVNEARLRRANIKNMANQV